MLVPTVFHPTTFSCDGGCSVPHSPWITHLSPHHLSLGKMAVNFQHRPLWGIFWGVSSLAIRWAPWECGHPLFPQPVPFMLQKVGCSPPTAVWSPNSLEIRLGTGWSRYSALDLWQHLSEVATACCQPSTSRRGMTTK